MHGADHHSSQPSGRSTATTAATGSSLVGSWQLTALEVHSPEGEVSHPMGRETAGFLVYQDNGWMSMHIMRPGRPSFGAGERLGGTPEELRLAFEGYLAYWGTYTVDPPEKTVTHRVVGSLYPNWIGTEQVRTYELQRDRLRITTPPMPVSGRPQTSHLIWRRVG